MNNKLINSENWTYTHYKAQNMKAFISFGALPEGSINQSEFIYMATVLDEENNEIFQRDFDDIDSACQFINKRYNPIWDFIDARVAKKEGGCSTCVAH